VVASAAQALAIDEQPPPGGQVGVPYSFRFNMEPGSGSIGMTWKILSGSLPPGLSLSYNGERYATVSGTPTQAGKWSFYLQAIDIPGPWVCCSERPFSITIDTRLVVATSALPDAPINQPYSQQLTATGGSVSSWSVVSGTLPDGITLAANGAVSGTPSKAGTYVFTVRANGSPNSDTKQLALFVAAPLDLGGPTGEPAKSQPVPVNAKVTTPFVWGVKASGGKLPYAYSSTPLPAGLTLNPDGSLSGTPTLASTTKVTFTVTDALGGKDTLDVTLTVKALLAFSKTAVARPGRVDSAYAWKIPVTGAGKTRIFVASGSFPPGLALDEATGILSGKPLAPGSYRLKIWVIGDAGTQISKTFTIKIAK